jgi:hypothetical protein
MWARNIAQAGERPHSTAARRRVRNTIADVFGAANAAVKGFNEGLLQAGSFDLCPWIRHWRRTRRDFIGLRSARLTIHMADFA